jgi:hypothetical protein
MNIVANIPVPFSVILLADANSNDMPEAMNGELVAHTDTCIAVGTLQEDAGSTSLTMSDELSEPTHTHVLVAEIKLSLPSGAAALVTADNEELGRLICASKAALVRVWVNDAKEPSSIFFYCAPVEVAEID